MLRGLAGLDIVSADLVEVSPPYDPAGTTANAAAAVAYDLVSLLVSASRTVGSSSGAGRAKW